MASVKKSAAALESRFAATPARAADIAGATVRQVEYWRKSNLVTPTLSRRLSARNEVRLYNVADLVELRVVGELRRQGLSLQHIRAVVRRLRKQYASPLRELHFAVVGKELYFQHTDGSWEGGLRPDQLVFHSVLAIGEIRSGVVQAISRGRSADEAGRVVRRRGVRGSRPVFDGTRVPLSAVQAWLDRGASDSRILEAYPDLTAADIEAARLASAS